MGSCNSDSLSARFKERVEEVGRLTTDSLDDGHDELDEDCILVKVE